MDILRVISPAMIGKEIAVHLLAYNLVHGLMARAAAGRQVIARVLSFKGSLQLLLAFQLQLRWSGIKATSLMSEHLLGAIGLMMLPVRPRRVEPYVIKRCHKKHALLTIPRHIARERIMQMRAAWA